MHFSLKIIPINWCLDNHLVFRGSSCGRNQKAETKVKPYNTFVIQDINKDAAVSKVPKQVVCLVTYVRPYVRQLHKSVSSSAVFYVRWVHINSARQVCDYQLIKYNLYISNSSFRQIAKAAIHPAENIYEGAHQNQAPCLQTQAPFAHALQQWTLLQFTLEGCKCHVFYPDHASPLNPLTIGDFLPLLAAAK